MRSLLITGAVLALVRLAQAGPDDPVAPTTDAKAAEKLFEEGRVLKDHGKLAEACAKFDEALARNHNAVGTILNVALCDEQAGKIASAWKLFTEAHDRAEEQNLGEHRKAAADHIAKLKDRVPKLTLAFAEKPTVDTKIVVDNAIVSVSAAGDVERIPIDPGERTIVVNAPGRVAYETRVVVVEGKDPAVAIPKLAYPLTVHKARRTVGKVVTYTGVGLVAAGIGIGLYARHLYGAQFDNHECVAGVGDAPATCTMAGYNNTQTARTFGWVGTGTGVFGIAATGVGAFLWFFAPTETDKLAIVPTMSPDHVGFTAIGRF
ncbi:MAG: hypothetical protein JWO36_4703 [Myxococcales bacterium]|nr:hypothetical protein [Myxococcales bacterium]